MTATPTEIPASLCKVSISSDGGTTWVEIKGLKSLTAAKSATKVDVTTFDDDGNSHMGIVRRSTTFTLDGFFYADPTTGDRDPGQLAVEALDGQIGPGAEGMFQIILPGTTTGTPAVAKTYTFKASAVVDTPFGGNKDEYNAWKATLEQVGAGTRN